MIELLQILICSCSTDISVDAKPPSALEGPILTLCNEDLEIIMGKLFFPKIIRESVQIEATAKIAIYLCWESKKSSKFFLNIIKDGISKGSVDQLKPHFKLLTALLGLKDSIQPFRIEAALYSHLKVIESNVFRKETTDKYVKYLVKLANKNEDVKMWLFKHKDILNEVLGEAGYRII